LLIDDTAVGLATVIEQSTLVRIMFDEQDLAVLLCELKRE
jgi:hypothetical protein